MKKPRRQEFPPGWNEKKVRAVIAHYDAQTEDEAAGEIKSAREAIENHAKNGPRSGTRHQKKRTRAKKAS